MSTMSMMSTMSTKLAQIREHIQAEIVKHEESLKILRNMEQLYIQSIEKMKADERQNATADERRKTLERLIAEANASRNASTLSANDKLPTVTVTKIDKTISKWGGDETNGWDRAYGVEKNKEYTFKVMEGFNPELGNLIGWGNYIVRYGTLITGTVKKIDDNLDFFSLKDVKINAKEIPDTIIEIPINVLEHVDENKRGIHIALSDFGSFSKRKQQHFSADEFNKKIKSAGDIVTKVSMIEVGETYDIVLKNGDTINGGKVSNVDERGYIYIEGHSGKIDAEGIETITKIDGFMFRSFKVKRSVKRKVKRSAKRSAKRSVKKVKRSIARKTKRSTKKGKVTKF